MNRTIARLIAREGANDTIRKLAGYALDEHKGRKEAEAERDALRAEKAASAPDPAAQLRVERTARLRARQKFMHETYGFGLAPDAITTAPANDAAETP